MTDRDQAFALELRAGLGALTKLIKVPSERRRSQPALDRARVAAGLRARGDAGAAQRFEDCGRVLPSWVGQCVADERHTAIFIRYSCMLRVCPYCAGRRAAQLAHDLTPAVVRLAGGAPRGYRLRHVVLTTSISLADAMPHDVMTIRSLAWSVLRDHWRDDRLLGALAGVEFGERGRRLHVHMLVLSRWIDHLWLADAWRSITGGAGRVVHVSAVRDVAKSVREVAKYVTKVAKFEREWDDLEDVLVCTHFAIKGVRRFQGYGSFYNLPREEDGYSDNVCPDCGAPVHFLPLWRWIERRKEIEIEDARLHLIQANKFREKPTLPAHAFPLPP